MNEDIEELLGKTLLSVEKSKVYDNDEIIFTTIDGEEYRMYHDQDCCESVYIEDVVGDLRDLVGSPLTIASKRTQDDPKDEYGITMWTFYSFATINGYVDIRWCGSSNGYYSVGVYIEKV